MHVEITGRHAPVAESLKDHIHEKLEHVLRHHHVDLTSVHIVLDSERVRQTAEIIVHGRNLSATVHADSEDMQAAVDRCMDKLKHALEHHHGRRRDKRRRTPGLRASEVELAVMEEAARARALADELDEIEEDTRIIRTPATELKPMTVDEACTELEGSARDFLLFRDSVTEGVAVLYRRRDGHLGLIETGA